MSINKKNKGGAPKKVPEDKVDQDLRCKVNRASKEWVDRMAKEAGYSRTSDYIRDRVMGTAHPKAIITMPSKRFLASFFGFSTNLNQLMRHLHTYKEVMDEGSVKLLIQRNIELKNEVRLLREEILGEFDNETVLSIAINNLSLEDLDTVKEGIEGRMH
ncbi:MULTISPECIES: hypothetical protein [Vibrio]|uniref:Mobilization protein n=1 Tax=Vibrio kanaloae TaxID=170673 RepID=A0A4U1YX30_9VIBR|nr:MULTISPECIES: hypothetical protein [Vibrio]TKF24601.1 hypothetical protein FCV50_23060 [Vibrio kanaloae]TWD71410.1 hypothetical protein FB444_101321 [Vibrio crassostreae]